MSDYVIRLEKVDQLICDRIEFAATKKREGVGTTGTDPTFWDGLWTGELRALQNLREDLRKIKEIGVNV